MRRGLLLREGDVYFGFFLTVGTVGEQLQGRCPVLCISYSQGPKKKGYELPFVDQDLEN